MKKIKTSWVIESKIHLAFKIECSKKKEMNMNSEVNQMIKDWLKDKGVKGYD